jgi:hypothetical protein
VDPGPFFYIIITIYLLLILFTFLQTITFYHSIRLILCSQHTGEIGKLIVSWDKVLGCVVSRFHVATGAKLHPGQVFWYHCWGPKKKKLPRQLRASKTSSSFLRHCPELSQNERASTFGSLVLSPTGSINLGFTTEGRLAAVLIITFSWGFQLGGYIYKNPTSTSQHQYLLATESMQDHKQHRDDKSINQLDKVLNIHRILTNTTCRITQR